MLPRFAVNDMPDVRVPDSKLLGYSLLCFSVCPSLADFNHLTYREFCEAITLTVTDVDTLPPLCNPISIVVRHGSGEQVGRVYTWSVVAPMQRPRLIRWQRAVRQGVRDAMRKFLAVSTVAVQADVPLPRPARIGATRHVGLTPESLDLLWGKLVAHLDLQRRVPSRGRVLDAARHFVAPIIPQAVQP